jgi:trehalose 6-phosphate phosphatase
VSDDPVELARRIAARVDPEARALIALDNDGTLSPIAPTPDQARLAPGARAALLTLCATADVAIVSGRGLDDLVERFRDLPVHLVSEHGLRHRSPSHEVEALTQELDDSTLAELRTGLAALLGPSALEDGWLIEDKGVSVAVHYRAVPAELREPTLTQVGELLAAIATSGGALQAGKEVLELRPAGADKGAALRALSAASPGAFVVMVGDDVTDESALAFAESSGGIGVLVADEPRPSAASARLRTPADVVELLEELGRTLGRGLRPGR